MTGIEKRRTKTSNVIVLEELCKVIGFNTPTRDHDAREFGVLMTRQLHRVLDGVFGRDDIHLIARSHDGRAVGNQRLTIALDGRGQHRELAEFRRDLGKRPIGDRRILGNL